MARVLMLSIACLFSLAAASDAIEYVERTHRSDGIDVCFWDEEWHISVRIDLLQNPPGLLNTLYGRLKANDPHFERLMKNLGGFLLTWQQKGLEMLALSALRNE